MLEAMTGNSAKDLEILVGSKVAMIQQCILMLKKDQQYHGLNQEELCQQLQGDDPSLLLSSAETTAGDQYPDLGSWYRRDMDILEQKVCLWLGLNV